MGFKMGFAEGVQTWRRFLKPDGVLVCSESTWTTAERPLEIEEFWTGEYPQIDLASAKIELPEQAGYSPRGYFVLPDECWTEGFYGPLTKRLDAVGQESAAEPQAQAIISAQRAEIDTDSAGIAATGCTSPASITKRSGTGTPG